MTNPQLTAARIIEREIRNVRKHTKTITDVCFDEYAEVWYARIDGVPYFFEVGSDDDVITFTPGDEYSNLVSITFDFPADWPV